MKTNTKINDIRVNLNSTINLAEQYENDRYNWLVDNGYLPEPHSSKGVIIVAIITLICLLGIILPKTYANASYDELSMKDKIRMERKEVCYRVQRELQPELSYKYINKCATTMTLNYAIESKFGQIAVRPHNKLGLKGWQNGKYGFLTFKSEYEARLYWAKKFYTYHYKKSMRTYIYGFKQKDGSWKWGYTNTQKDMYYNFFLKRWNKIYREMEDLKLNLG